MHNRPIKKKVSRKTFLQDQSKETNFDVFSPKKKPLLPSPFLLHRVSEEIIKDSISSICF